MKIQSVKVDRQNGRYSKSRIYIFPTNESITDNLMNRHTRPSKLYRKEVLPKLFEQLQWDKNTTVKWSQYAGCSCPCSPGFIVDNVYGASISVEVQ